MPLPDKIHSTNPTTRHEQTEETGHENCEAVNTVPVQRTSEHLLNGIIESLADGVVTIDEKGLIQSFNPAAVGIFYYTAEEVIGCNVNMLMAEPDASQHDGYLRHYVETGESNIIGAGPREVTGRRKDGTTFPLELVIGEMRRVEGRLFISTLRDISERKALEREATEQSALLNTTIDTIAQGYAVHDRDMRLIRFNAQFEKLFDFPAGFLRRGMSQEDLIRFRAQRGDYGAGDIEEIIRNRFENAKTPGERHRERTLATGTTYIHHRKSLPDRSCVTTYTDITSLKRAQREADTKAALLESSMQAMAQGYAVYDSQGRLAAYNSHFETMFEFPAGFLGPNTTLEDIIRCRLEHERYETQTQSCDDIENEVARRLKNFVENEKQTGERNLPDGKAYVYSRMPMPDGGVVCTYTDMTDTKETKKALKESEAKFRGVFENASVGVFIRSADGKSREYNDTFCKMLGYSEAEMQSMNVRDIAHPDDDPQATSIRNISFDSRDSHTVERRLIRKDGKVIWCYNSYRKVYDAEGNFKSTIAMCQDITERKEAEHGLQQAQKMEAVGQLTGGVAHDFNNLLAVIMGNTELLAEGADNPESLLASISRSAARGAELTQRLLAFSRLQPLHPQPMDLSDLIDGMMELLQRTLGETIEISAAVAPDLWQAQADPGQVENALLNLAINARDAMRDGGRLTIACTNTVLDADQTRENTHISPGDYVELKLTDTGTGMAEDVLEHVFEPFYTTKEVGQGSGLGLSMVYGFAQQSCGQITIDSEEGKGTRVKLYLPRAETELAVQAAKGDEETPKGQGEKILVVEDDPEVRNLVEAMIGGLGYQVVTATAAADARVVLENENIDLVISDVVLPDGVNGPAFAQEARAFHPGLTVIFMSGYPAGGAADDSALDADEVLLSKPFARHELATTLHQALIGI